MREDEEGFKAPWWAKLASVNIIVSYGLYLLAAFGILPIVPFLVSLLLFPICYMTYFTFRWTWEKKRKEEIRLAREERERADGSAEAEAVGEEQE